MSLLLLSTVPETQPWVQSSALCLGVLHWAGSVAAGFLHSFPGFHPQFIAGEATRITRNSDNSDKEEGQGKKDPQKLLLLP